MPHVFSEKEPEDSLSADLTGNYTIIFFNIKNLIKRVNVLFLTGNLVDPAEFASAGIFLSFNFSFVLVTLLSCQK
jgi:hypothetical protein